MAISERFYNPQDNYGYHIVSVIRSCYGKEVINFSKRPDGQGFEAINSLYKNYSESAVKPDLRKVKERNEYYQELLNGVSHFMTNRLVTDKLSSLSDQLLGQNDKANPIVVTDDLQKYSLRMRELFPREDDAKVQRACTKGLVQGWITLLDLVDTEEVPLLLYPKELVNDLKANSLDMKGEEIILPTTIPNVSASYDYSNDFPLPYITLQMRP